MMSFIDSVQNRKIRRNYCLPLTRRQDGWVERMERLMGMKFLLGWWKCSKIRSLWWLYNSVNILKNIELYALNGWILCHNNFYLNKAVKTKSSSSDWPVLLSLCDLFLSASPTPHLGHCSFLEADWRRCWWLTELNSQLHHSLAVWSGQVTPSELCFHTCGMETRMSAAPFSWVAVRFNYNDTLKSSYKMKAWEDGQN